jgi:prepilin-type N-terminal cleavage/methylation domain-containing protein
MKKQGFTLFEMLLVIAIIAMMSSLGILTYRRHAMTERIDRAALQMQQVLAAAMAYNTDNSATWPVSFPNVALGQPVNCLDSTATPAGNFVSDYLPNATYTSSFGAHFCWDLEQNVSAGASPGALFWVALPFNADQQDIAKRMAALLPNGVTLASPNDPAPTPGDQSNACVAGQVCYVRAEVVQPGAASAVKATTNVAGVGRCLWTSESGNNEATPGSSGAVNCTEEGVDSDNYKNYVVSFPCGANEEGYVVFMPNSFYTGKSGSRELSLNAINVRGEGVCTQAAGRDVFSCDIGVSLESAVGSSTVSNAYSRGGILSGSYVAYCRTPPASDDQKQML